MPRQLRQAAKRDANEAPIVMALREAGAVVWIVSQGGLLDLLVGYQGETFLLEVKSKGGRLTPAEQHFFDTWNGGVAAKVHTPQEALRVIGAIE